MRSRFPLKRAYSQALAVFIALITSFFFSFSEPFWLSIAALIVMQTQVGLTLRGGLQNYLRLLVIVILGTLIHVFIPYYLGILIAVFLLGISIIDIDRWSIFAIMLFFTISLPAENIDLLHLRIYDLTLGAAIGIIVNLFIFPIRADTEFRKNLIPILNLYVGYLHALGALLFKKNHAEEEANISKIQLEKILQSKSDLFPIWVYESGLSFTLQPGHRHFLIMIERVAEILTSMHSIARHSFPTDMIETLEDPLDKFIAEANQIIRAIVAVLTLNKLQEPVSDLKEELITVEKKISDLIPHSFEITNSDEDYFLLIALMEDLKDLRLTLINLGNSLQTACSIPPVTS